MDKRRMGIVVFLLLLTVGCMAVMGKESVSWDGVTLPDGASLIPFSPQLNWVTYERQYALWLAPLPNVEDEVTLMRDYTVGLWRLEASWLPDGTGFVMDSYKDVENDGLGTQQTWWLTKVNDLDEQIPLCTLPDLERVIRWSPDSTAFALITRGGSVTIVHTDGSGCEEIPDFSLLGLGNDVAWSPDGQKIAYFCYPQSEIQVINLSTYETTTLYADLADIGTPIWFPDGERIGFRYKGDVLVFHADGSGLIKKVEVPDGYGLDFAWKGDVWSPDDSHLAIALWAPDLQKAIGILDSDDLTLAIVDTAPILGSPYFYQILGWTPDDKALVVSMLDESTVALREVPVTP